MRFSKSFSLLVLTLACSSGFSQVLWGGTTHGMSEDQVRKTIPQVVRPNNPSSTKFGAELLRLNRIDIGSISFRASFYFSDQKLVQVTLQQDPAPKSFTQALQSYENIRELLRASYGKEISEVIKRGQFGTADGTWLSDKTNITLYAMGIGNEMGLLNIVYQMRIATESGKL